MSHRGGHHGGGGGGGGGQRHGGKHTHPQASGRGGGGDGGGGDESAAKRARFTPRPSAHSLTVRDLITDALAPLANQYWAPGAPSHAAFDAQIIETVYAQHLAPTNAKATQRLEREAKGEKEDAGAEAEEEAEQTRIEAQRAQRLLLLELSAYLENYLWKYYDPATATFAHVMSFVMLINQKFKGENRVGIWEPFQSRPADLVALLERISRLKTERDLTLLEANQLLVFFIHAFESFEEPSVRRVFMRLASIDSWRCLRDTSILRVLRTNADGGNGVVEGAPAAAAAASSDLRTVWKKVSAKPSNDFAAAFLPNLLTEFVHILYSIDESSRVFQLDGRSRRLPYAVRDHVLYLERFLEFLIGLLSKLSTRRWAKKVVEEIHLLVLCRQSTLVQRTQQKEREIAEQQAALAERGSVRGSGSAAMDLEVLAASTSSSGGAILSLDNHSNTNGVASASQLPGRLFCQLLSMLDALVHFEIDDVSGKQLGAQEVLNRHYLDVQILQKVCFKFFADVPQLLNVALANVSRLDDPDKLTEMLEGISEEQMRDLCVRMQLLPRDEEVEEYKKAAEAPQTQTPSKKKGAAVAAPAAGAVPRIIVSVLRYMKGRSFLLSLLLSHLSLRSNTLASIASMPLYPSEKLLFDEHAIPSMNYSGESVLALPKLNLQFLTVHDYLQRNFQLYQGESTYEIREDIAYTLKRLKPRVANDGGTVFTGWARMACPLMSFAVTGVLKPLIGQSKPSAVRAEITVDLSVFNGVVREEWENLRTHDVLFLLAVQALTPINAPGGNSAMLHARQGGGNDRGGRPRVDVEGMDLEGLGVAPDESFKSLQSEPLFVQFVRGAEVKSVLDGHKRLIGERDDKGNVYKARGSIRTFRVELDTAQYGLDQAAEVAGRSIPGGGSPVSQVYSSFNLVLRRKPKENNFKGVLETIRDLMDDTAHGAAAIPAWLSNVFLGYGNPKDSQYYSLPTQLEQIEFIDTFIDLQHLRDSFAENVAVQSRSAEEIEAEMRGEKEIDLVALGGEANNRQTAASTSIQLTRQVMRLVAQAQKEKQQLQIKEGGEDAAAAAAAADSAPVDSSNSTFRVTFPAKVEPNYEVLQQLLYVRGAASLAAPTVQADFVLAEGEQTVKALEAAKGNKDGEEEDEEEEGEVAQEDEAMEEGETEEGEVADDADAAPPAFTMDEPKFTLTEPVKPEPSAAAAAPAASDAAPSADAAAASADVEAEIAGLGSLTVVKLKELMKPLDLSVVGVKAVLIERLAEAMREKAKADAPAADAGAAAAKAAKPADAGADADAEVAYEKELAAYNAAKSAHDAELEAYRAAKQKHDEETAAFNAAQKKKAKAKGKKAAPKAKKAASPSKAKKAAAEKKKTAAAATAATTAATAAPVASSAVVPFVLPPSPHTLSVELLPRVHARHDYVRRNQVRFTPIQVEAIKSGLNPGLTMIVGPPGTGKTDTAVQIISEIYHNFPEQRTLLITHSNSALNDLFAKIMERDIDERYLLRLGRGSEDVASDSDMGKFGRVNYMLQRRLTLLDEVAALARSLNMSDDVAYTCETSGHFFLAHVLSRWEKFASDVQAVQRSAPADPQALNSFVQKHFPFATYFQERSDKQAKIWAQYYQNSAAAAAAATDAVATTTAEAATAAPSAGGDAMELDDGTDGDATAAAAASTAVAAVAAPVAAAAAAVPSSSLFRGASLSEDMSIAVSCFADLQQTFVELEETRPFELLRTYKDRSNYLLTKHAKIIAMTCTHAAIKRKDMVDLNFRFDNIVMEESAQILEIETFIPMLLQRADSESGSRLKRIILLGDHHQLPPVIKNRAFQKYSHMDQSLFTRFIRLGMPYVQLNAQGRMRSSLASLWNWKYANLGNLPAVQQNPAYITANVGFAHEYQLINVDDLNGIGESSPTPFFYQNLAEAEYIVQTYMYMRLLGYPADRISILTTYNGQKHLIRDILQQRCANNLLFGLPNKVSTVDKFQGQQNDYILLSLVRTRTAGHLRDVRRLVVAMSRARLGLYIFGRVQLFTNCFELTRTFNQLLQKPVRLQIVPGEKRPMDQPLSTARLASAPAEPAQLLEVRDVLHMGELVAAMTLSVQSEYGEYQRRIFAAQEEERMRQMQREQAMRQYEEAREQSRREDARLAALADRDAEHARETEQLERELAQERDDKDGGAAQESGAPPSDDESGEEDEA